VASDIGNTGSSTVQCGWTSGVSNEGSNFKNGEQLGLCESDL
jgi:hypothetical protein